jgi:hypothetical protein
MLRAAMKLSCFGLAIMIATPALAGGLNRFVGTWTNLNYANPGITKVVIERSGMTLLIRTYGACTPKPCDWGAQPGTAYARTVSSNLLTAANAATVVYKFGFEVKTLTLIEVISSASQSSRISPTAAAVPTTIISKRSGNNDIE